MTAEEAERKVVELRRKACGVRAVIVWLSEGRSQVEDSHWLRGLLVLSLLTRLASNSSQAIVRGNLQFIHLLLQK